MDRARYHRPTYRARSIHVQRVIQLELEVRVEQSLEAEGDAVVAGLCAALDRHQAGRIERQRVDPVQGVTGTSGLVSDRWQPRAPWVAEHGVITVDEPRQVIGAGVGVAD